MSLPIQYEQTPAGTVATVIGWGLAEVKNYFDSKIWISNLNFIVWWKHHAKSARG
jgi:hypothetical protein